MYGSFIYSAIGSQYVKTSVKAWQFWDIILTGEYAVAAANGIFEPYLSKLALEFGLTFYIMFGGWPYALKDKQAAWRQ